MDHKARECTVQGAKRLEADGPNKLSPPPDKPEWLKYLLQFANPLLAILIVASVLSFVAYGVQTPRDVSNVILGAVLLGMIFLLATTQYLNDRAASGVAKQLSSMLPQVRCSFSGTQAAASSHVHVRDMRRTPCRSQMV